MKNNLNGAEIQNDIRNYLSGKCLLFRANVGEGWTGSKFVKLDDGSVLIKNARRFSTGIPTGFSDLFGMKTVKITADMVGTEIAVFVAVEVKSENDTLKPEQRAFLTAVKHAGGRAGVARSAEQAEQIMNGTLSI